MLAQAGGGSTCSGVTPALILCELFMSNKENLFLYCLSSEEFEISLSKIVRFPFNLHHVIRDHLSNLFLGYCTHGTRSEPPCHRLCPPVCSGHLNLHQDEVTLES